MANNAQKLSDHDVRNINQIFQYFGLFNPRSGKADFKKPSILAMIKAEKLVDERKAVIARRYKQIKDSKAMADYIKSIVLEEAPHKQKKLQEG